MPVNDPTKEEQKQYDRTSNVLKQFYKKSDVNGLVNFIKSIRIGYSFDKHYDEAEQSSADDELDEGTPQN